MDVCWRRQGPRPGRGRCSTSARTACCLGATRRSARSARTKPPRRRRRRRYHLLLPRVCPPSLRTAGDTKAADLTAQNCVPQDAEASAEEPPSSSSQRPSRGRGKAAAAKKSNARGKAKNYRETSSDSEVGLPSTFPPAPFPSVHAPKGGAGAVPRPALFSRPSQMFLCRLTDVGCERVGRG